MLLTMLHDKYKLAQKMHDCPSPPFEICNVHARFVRVKEAWWLFLYGQHATEGCP